jgi:hypothetical protein
LCHSDLRPPPPRPAAPALSTTIVVAPVPGSVLQEVRPDTAVDLDEDEDEDDAPVGRHSRRAPDVEAALTAPATPRPSRALPPRGKHAGSARRTSTPRPRPDLAAALPLDELVLPADGTATPEQVDELADQMLTHLALTEPQPRLLDPDDFPGGRWGLAAAGLVAMIVILLVLYTVLGVILG